MFNTEMQKLLAEKESSLAEKEEQVERLREENEELVRKVEKMQTRIEIVESENGRLKMFVEDQGPYSIGSLNHTKSIQYLSNTRLY